MSITVAIKAIVATLGGIRGTIFAAAAAALAGLLLFQSSATGAAEISLAMSQAELADLRASIALSTAANADAIASAERRARERSEELSAAYILAASNYDRGMRDAEDAGAHVVADLRADNLRLHRRWTDAEARARDVSSATPGAGASDAAALDRAESAARIVRAAAECDAQVTALQDIVRAVSSISRDAQ